jgi:hypothetical protein
MKCPTCGSEMVLRYYKNAEEAFKDALRYLPNELIGKPVWYCKKCLAIIPGW